jgi:hypothetical protein
MISPPEISAQWAKLRAAIPAARVVMPPPFPHLTPQVQRQIARDQVNDEKLAGYARTAAKWAAMRPVGPAAADDPDGPEDDAPDGLALSWYDEQGFYAGPEEAAEISDQDRAFAFSADGEFAAICHQKTGKIIEPEKLKKSRAEDALLLEVSHEICAKLATVGVNGYRADPLPLWLYFIHSGRVEMLPFFRRLMFNPWMAKRVRAAMVTSLTAFLEREPFARMWTFTTGERCKLSELRERIETLHRKISALNGSAFMKDLGVRIVFRSTELGTPEFDSLGNSLGDAGEIERDEKGEPTFHPHAHVVVILTKGFIPGERWERLLCQVGARWRAWWKDGGTNEGKATSGLIRNVREVCKYMFKPAELRKLKPPELAALEEQLSGLHIYQPMGALRAEIRSRKERKMRLSKTDTPDGAVYREVKDHNVHARRTRTEKVFDEAGTLKRKPAPHGLKLLARLEPSFGSAGVSEPRVLLMGTTWDEAAVRGLKAVRELTEATAQRYAEGLRAVSFISVHTCTATVREFPGFEHVDPGRNVPRAIDVL